MKHPSKIVLQVTLWMGALSCLPSRAVGQTVPSCSNAGDNPSSAGGHSVTLSWNASTPASASQKDAIKGYYIYRSSVSNQFKDQDRLNSTPVQGTRCIDRSVAPGGTYFYAVASVTTKGAKSNHSAQVKAVVPSP